MTSPKTTVSKKKNLPGLVHTQAKNQTTDQAMDRIQYLNQTKKNCDVIAGNSGAAYGGTANGGTGGDADAIHLCAAYGGRGGFARSGKEKDARGGNGGNARG